MEWTRESLQSLIDNHAEEDSQLEYKSAKALSSEEGKKREMCKDVSAFANAGGGTLIYGVAEFQEDDRKHLPEKLDPVNQTEFSREWLDQILGLIRPRIAGLKIIPIHVGPGGSDCCYVVEVPQGETAHQARDHKYYRRRNFEASPMEDYEVREVMNRRVHPQVKSTLLMAIHNRFDDKHQLIYNIENISPVLARNIYCVIDFPLIIASRYLHFEAGSLVRDYNEPAFWRLCVSNDGDRPLFPGSNYSRTFEATELPGPLSLSSNGVPLTETITTIRVKTYADVMPFIEEVIDPNSIITRIDTLGDILPDEQ